MFIVVAASVLAVLPTQMANAGAPGKVGHLVVRTDEGLVRGARAEGVDSFLGIPYAAAPVGHFRWRPPQPAAAWRGVRSATSWGEACPQAASDFGNSSVDEDCLSINVQRPAHLRRGDHRAVLAFIHGGALLQGSSSQFDGAPMVAQTGAIVVTFNYRLGVFGFMGHPALTREAGESGNYGLMDQQAALRWVRRNIDAFGGDPHKVTIDGQSAGAWSVCAHLAAPGSRGLFAQGMMQSGSCPSETQAETDAFGQTVAQQVGCATPATVLNCLRSAPAAELLEATPDIMLFTRGTSILPNDPRVAIARGDFTRVPMVIGANRDEFRSFIDRGVFGWTEDQYMTELQQDFGTFADAVLAHYPWPTHANRFTAAYLLSAVFTDIGAALGIGGCPNLELTQDLAKYTRTYAYEFDHRSGPGQLLDSTAYKSGAGHGAELAYLFPSFSNGAIAPTFDAAERRLATQMKRYWGAFVKRGAPRPRAPRQTAWPRYGTSHRTLSLRTEGHTALISDQTLSREHQCAFWNAPSTTIAKNVGRRAANAQVK